MKSIPTSHRIIQAAIATIAKEGMQSSAMKKICHKSGYSPGTVYHHFKDKDEIISRSFQHLLFELSKSFHDALQEDAPLRERLFRAWIALLTYFIKQPDHFFFYRQIVNGHSFLSGDENSSQFDEFVQPLELLILNGKNEESLKSLPVKLLLMLFFDHLHSVVAWQFQHKEEMSKSELSESLVALWDLLRKTSS
ncbi:MAG: TetR/AcrR family transcriptional regulator [Cyclobacteriaceae bacterium]|nr:TetR/AcrR family transcriptional regulator [Cyclobacteriaceae bacterium]MCH8517280.1 TetR/AcrR family transcriptional regulator [Cyclobacteriaceae bacterium]